MIDGNGRDVHRGDVCSWIKAEVRRERGEAGTLLYTDSTEANMTNLR